MIVSTQPQPTSHKHSAFTEKYCKVLTKYVWKVNDISVSQESVSRSSRQYSKTRAIVLALFLSIFDSVITMFTDKTTLLSSGACIHEVQYQLNDIAVNVSSQVRLKYMALNLAKYLYIFRNKVSHLTTPSMSRLKAVPLNKYGVVIITPYTR